jgi:hypothetical protein
MRIALAAGLLFLAPGAFAEKIAVLNFTGPDAASVRAQVTDALCGQATCVEPKKVSKGPKPDWAKAKKEKIEFFVTGTVKGKGAKRTLELQVLNKAGPAKLKKSVPLAKLDSLVTQVKDVMGLESAAPAPEPEKKVEPAPEPEKQPEAEAPKEEGRKRKQPTEAPPPPKEEERAAEEKPAEAGTEEAAPEQPASGEFKPPAIEFEVGADLFSRSFSYNNVSTNNLRSYSASFIFAPEFRAEVYPLAFFSKGIISGLGVDGAVAFSLGLKSRRTGTDTTWPTNIVHYDFNLRFRLRPVSSIDAAVIPFVGYGNQGFSVGTGSDGSTLDGLPSVSYSSVRAGLAGELPFSSSGFMVFAKFAALIVLSSGEIISPAFFPKGSNFGIEGQVGAGYRLPFFNKLQVRVAFDFTRYGLGFASSPTDTYQAQSAADLYLGGNLALRLIF